MSDFKLSTEELARYSQDGFLGVHQQLFSEADLSHIQRLSYSAHEKAQSPYIALTGAHYYEPTLLEFVTRPEMLDPIEQIIGPNIGLFSTTLFLKKPNTTATVDWHRDSEYLRTYGVFSSIQLVSMLIALTDSDSSNGGVEYVPGSHLNPTLRDLKISSGSRRMFTQADESTEYQLSSDETSKKRLVSLRAGEYSLHDIQTLHGSAANKSSQVRALLNLKFFPTSLTTYRSEVKEKFNIEQDFYLVRGQDLSGGCNISLI